MNKVILDANAYSNLRRGDRDVRKAIENSETINFSVVVLGELLEGFKLGNRLNKNKEELDEFLEEQNAHLIKVSKETAEVYAEIKNHLRKRGTPVPINDVWIAAHAIETGSVLITFDERHFSKIPQVRLWSKLTSKN